MTITTIDVFGSEKKQGVDIQIHELKVEYETSEGSLQALDIPFLHLVPNDSLGIAGESGCGKSTLAWSIMRSLPENARVKQGKIIFSNNDILAMSENDFSKYIRWKQISVIPQAAMNIFDPIFSIRDQLEETIRVHLPESNKQDSVKRAENMLELVGIERKRAQSYPHEFSGGMRQRAAIALALALGPSVLIADEPTTALDVIVQAQIMSLLVEIKESLGMSMILISHDLSLVAQYCTKIVIMYAGRIVEHASAQELFDRPLHPYTLALFQSVPDLNGERIKLKAIPGTPPSLLKVPKGCRFAPRCEYATTRCHQEDPPLEQVYPGHYSACFEWKRLDLDNNE